MTALRQMYGDVYLDEKSYYEATNDLIDEQASKYLEILIKYKSIKESEVIVNAWAEHQKAEEVRKVQSLKMKYYDSVAGYEKESFEVRKEQIEEEGREVFRLTHDERLQRLYVAESNAKSFIKMATDSNYFFDGVRAGFMTLHADAITWGMVGKDTATTFKTSLGTELGNSIYDLITGKFQGIGPYAVTVADNVVKSFTQTLGKMASESITDLMSPMVKSFTGLFINDMNTGIFDSLGYWYHDALYEMGSEDSTVTGLLAKGWTTFKDFFSAAGTGIWDVMKSGYDIAIKWMGEIDVGSYLSTAWNFIREMFADEGGTSIWSYIKTGYTTLLNWLSKIDVSSYISTAWNAVTTLFGSFEKGAWNLQGPSGGFAVEVHEGEMILPKTVAKTVRDYLTQGSFPMLPEL
jgi:hypothetical protein